MCQSQYPDSQWFDEVMSEQQLHTQQGSDASIRVRDHNNPSGDIEIEYSGLRPGEKLSEELLIDAEAMPTENKYIFRAKEKFYEYKEFFTKFKDFEASIRNKNENDVLIKLAQLVPEWKKPLN